MSEFCPQGQDKRKLTKTDRRGQNEVQDEVQDEKRQAPHRLPLVDLTPAQPSRAEGEDWTRVGPGRRVVMHFSLALTDGELIDGNFGRKPVEFVVGDGNLPAVFEKLLFGRGAGFEGSFELDADQAFGPVNPANVQRFSRRRFPPGMPLEPGLMVAFNDASGYEQAGVVTALEEDFVTVDFNHPLAGKPLRFTVAILSVDKP